MTSTLKTFALLSLVFQNSALVLLLRKSRIVQQSTNGVAYLACSIVIGSELLKFVTSLLLLRFPLHADPKQRTFSGCCSLLIQHTRQSRSTFVLLLVALLYYAQNCLLLEASALLPVVTFQLVGQLKLVFTALFSVMLLSKQLALHQWVAILLLSLGLGVTQSSSASSSLAPPSEPTDFLASSSFKGVVLLILACTTSGLAGTLIEREFKRAQPSSSNTNSPSTVVQFSSQPSSLPLVKDPTPEDNLWIRNAQLSCFSLLFGLLDVLKSRELLANGGFFQGFTVWTCFVLILQALGGVIVALVIKHADSVLKGFATSLSILLSAVAASLFFDEVPSFSPFFLLGSSMVCSSVLLYNSDLSFSRLYKK